MSEFSRNPSPSKVDQLLTDPEVQARVRDFFNDVDRANETLQQQGRTLNTSRGEQLSAFPTIITEEGLIVEISSTERASSSRVDNTLNQGSFDGDEIIGAIGHYASFDTKIVASLTDLASDSPEIVELTGVPAAGNNLKGIDAQNTFKHGGRIILRGRKSDSPFTNTKQMDDYINAAITGKQGDAAGEAFKTASRELAQEGAYYMLADLKRGVNDKGNKWRSAKMITSQSESFSKARKRNDFEL